jgi:hypothetical protein
MTTITTTYGLDPATAEYVTTVDGKETARTPAPPDVANRLTLQSRIAGALADNKTFLAIASPSAAQNAKQIKDLTRQVNGLLRLVGDRLDATD